MKLIARTAQSLAAVLFITLLPQLSTAGNINGALGIGGGTSPLWDEPSQGGIAVSGTFTYRLHGPSFSARYVGIVALTPIFDTYEETVSELAILGGWDFILPRSTSVAVRLGLGKMSYHGGYAHAQSWDYEGDAWGPALQFDAFWSRIGLTYMLHTGNKTAFSSVLFCVRLGHLDAD